VKRETAERPAGRSMLIRYAARRSPLGSGRVYLGLGLGNIAAGLLFAILLFLGPAGSQLDARMRFTELDRAGVVNPSALKQFHPDRGFGDIAVLEYRRTVPDYIASSALAAQQFNAGLGLLITFGNAIIWIVLWWRSP
jgi:hypothetical protein